MVLILLDSGSKNYNLIQKYVPVEPAINCEEEDY
jgi:hypothetical protein